MTKVLYPKRPALIPMLDSVVQKYLQDDDLGDQAPSAERALGLGRGYQSDLDRNHAAMQEVQQELARRGYRLTEVRILDLLILSTQAAAGPAGALYRGAVAAPPLVSGRTVSGGRTVNNATQHRPTLPQTIRLG
jgi:hypothetical protein